MDLYLAPMAGFSDSAMRRLCISCGADITMSEMISAKGIYYKDKKTSLLSYFSEEERPFGIQIFGSEPAPLEYAAGKMSESMPDFINLNAGCPTPKIVSCGDGCALMKDASVFEKAVSAVVKGSKVPVSVKMRLGWDNEHKNAPYLAHIAQECGAYEIHLHIRTREDFFSGNLDYETALKVKESVSVPVIMGGDIKSGKDAEYMYKMTSCSGIMIGRAAIGDPLVFKRIKEYLECGREPQYGIQEKMELAVRQIYMMYEQKGSAGILEARKHAAAYLKGVKGAKTLKEEAMAATAPEQLACIFRKAALNEKQ